MATRGLKAGVDSSFGCSPQGTASFLTPVGKSNSDIYSCADAQLRYPVCLAMGVQAEAPPAYFAGTHAKFQATADVLLQLRDGARLPAHRQLLACSSPVLCDLLEVAASQAAAGSMMVLPLEDFSQSEAVSILKARVP